ncbi:hypothetical protein [Burkholderia sp. D-99]|uniref:hypothetical protein n=1 Tax=Burkholderia sp. D-99 TaxID=2717316 RepID=UPI0014238D2C|nr:hypothetical protein [Burkholderia sp. D-99]NHV29711.1 hypothetical protein [Burkholderia sp. D-99]
MESVWRQSWPCIGVFADAVIPVFFEKNQKSRAGNMLDAVGEHASAGKKYTIPGP